MSASAPRVFVASHIVDCAAGSFPDIRPLSRQQLLHMTELYAAVAKAFILVEEMGGIVGDGILPISVAELVRIKRNLSGVSQNLEALENLHMFAMARTAG